MDYGIRVNRGQVLQWLLQVLLVGMTLGMTRTVVPALGESEFGVPRGSFMLLVAFVVAFGFVKGAMNFVAGRLAERIGRQRVLLVGWLVAVPIPVLVHLAPSWNWIVLAPVLLGVNQGLTWSMTQTAKLDLTRADQRGLVIGLNEFAGYVGVAAAGVVTGYAAAMLGTRAGLLWFGAVVIGLATLLAWLAIAETLPWAHAEVKRHAADPSAQALRPRYPMGVSERPSTREVFALMSWRDRRSAPARLGGGWQRRSRVWAWPCCIRTSARRWPTSRTRTGVRPQSASIASGATWATASARWRSVPPRPWAVGSKARSGSWPSRW